MSQLEGSINRPAAVLGAGPNLLDDFPKLPEGCVLFGVNHHAQLFTDLDYMVSNDDVTIGRDLAHEMAWRHTRAIRISRHKKQSDIVIDVPFWDAGMSSSTAIWSACWMVNGPIYLCGLDCWLSKRTHFYMHEPGVGSVTRSSKEHKQQIYIQGLTKLRDPNRIRVFSGALTEVFETA